MFVSRFQKILVILYQSGETQIWFLINVLGAFHHTVDCNYEHSGKQTILSVHLFCIKYYGNLLSKNLQFKKLFHRLSNSSQQTFDKKYIYLVIFSNLYSKVSIIRPGCSRLLEFEKRDSMYWLFNRDFFKKSRPGRLIETVSK